MKKLVLYNTETRQKEAVKPLDGKTIRMYTCGPTIYDFAHIGNFRTYVFEDVLRRTLQLFGYRVEQVMNITDIDDKTIRGALAKNISLKEYTEPYRLAFFHDLKTLNIEPVEHYPNATDYIPQMIQIIEDLLKKGFAYVSSNGSVYFAIRKFPKYGRLSHFSVEDLQVNASGENEADEYDKENVADFVLWKAYDGARDGLIFWESPFGKGRPGWHIECSAMAMELLGPSIDIHCGGVDNCFPHHENEIAQCECSSGHQFVRHWMHSEHLLVDHKKMSKSLGNFYTLRDLLKEGFTGAEVRYLLLSTHYRTQLNFTRAGLLAARASLGRISDLVDRLRGVQETGEFACSASVLAKADLHFQEALGDDLNVSVALAALFDLIRELNSLADERHLVKGDAEMALRQFEKWDKVLGVLPLHQKHSAPEHLEKLLARREEARRLKDWNLSDELRDEIGAAGYAIEDTATGARLKKK
ncbi:MAG TPA: cysteine--tRNA ligase [Chlamydiales bacterium]|nr:cysteine--tRNA ligase [Chlamydiales bacterium]